SRVGRAPVDRERFRKEEAEATALTDEPGLCADDSHLAPTGCVPHRLALSDRLGDVLDGLDALLDSLLDERHHGLPRSGPVGGHRCVLERHSSNEHACCPSYAARGYVAGSPHRWESRRPRVSKPENSAPQTILIPSLSVPIRNSPGLGVGPRDPNQP